MRRSRASILAFVLVLSMVFSQFAFAGEVPVVKISGDGIDEAAEFTLEDLKTVPKDGQIEEEYIYNSKAGEKSVAVKGVSLKYILEEIVSIDFNEGTVEFTAADGYPIDPQPLKDLLDENLKYVLAYEVDGEAVDNDDNPETDEIVVYRKVKEAGEFGTVLKLVVDLKITKEEAAEEPDVTDPEDTTEPTDPDVDVPAVKFLDITAEYEFAEEAIVAMAEKGIINGVGNNLYSPARGLTRAEFSKIMVISLGYELGEYDNEFNDVEKDAWYAPYVKAAVDNGLFNGYGDGTFKPGKLINRQEMAAVAARGAIKAGVVEEARMNKFVMEKSNFTDKESVPEWAANEVAWLEAQGVFENVAAEKFEATKVINRAEAAVIVYSTLFAQ